jgi:hypothetical protein
MNETTTMRACVAAAVSVLAACASNNPPPPNAPQPLVPGTEPAAGAMEQQAATDDEVVASIADARCDREASCNRVGPGAHYRNRDDCVHQNRQSLRTDLNSARCPGGIGEAGLTQCVKSLENGQCSAPGQDTGVTSHCKLDSMCMR